MQSMSVISSELWIRAFQGWVSVRFRLLDTVEQENE